MKTLITLFILLFSFPAYAGPFSIAGGGATGINADFDTGDTEGFIDARADIGEYGFMSVSYLGDFGNRYQAGPWAGARVPILGMELTGGVGLQRISRSGDSENAQAVRAGLEIPLFGLNLGAHFIRTFSDDFGNYNSIAGVIRIPF